MCRDVFWGPRLLLGAAVLGPGPVSPPKTPVFSCRLVRKACVATKGAFISLAFYNANIARL